LISVQYDGPMTVGQWGSGAWLHAQQAAGPQFPHRYNRNDMHNTPAPTELADARTVTVPYDRLRDAATRLLELENLPEIAKDCGEACAFLEACGYSGLKLLFEALDTTPAAERHPPLEPDTLGLDLKNVSCVFLAPRVAAMVGERGRLFLRNVRHGLYLVPFSVSANIGIGCPVDPAFALGGERTGNPYAEKLALARAAGLTVAETLWNRLPSQA
jgi:hypothetical protein